MSFDAPLRFVCPKSSVFKHESTVLGIVLQEYVKSSIDFNRIPGTDVKALVFRSPTNRLSKKLSKTRCYRMLRYVTDFGVNKRVNGQNQLFLRVNV